MVVRITAFVTSVPDILSWFDCKDIRPRCCILHLAFLSVLLSCASKPQALESSNPKGSDKSVQISEGFVIEPATIRGLVTYPMFATLDDTGRLFVMESGGNTTSTEDVLKNPSFKILLLEDTDDDGVFDKRHVYADSIPYPMGGTFYQGSFYATAPPDLIRFKDTNNDGIADEREVILTGWTLNHNAATLSGPFFGPDGWLYMCDARRGFDIRTKEGTRLQGKGARIWRCRPDGTGLEWVSGGGFDNTIEMIFMSSGETIGTMTYFTDPQNGFRDALMHWVEGGVYPKPYPVIEQDGLIRTGDLMPVMTKLARVSPSGLMRYRGDALGPEFEGNLFSAQFNTGRILRHLIKPDGATFTTEEIPFMQWDELDMHPTDVLQDADGSLLVVNTGGWFIAGCPLSVVAKEDVAGSIIRIRKKTASRREDPWGRKIDFQSLSANQLVPLLRDKRIFVRDKAVETLVANGEGSIASLEKLLSTSSFEEERLAAVFGLYRIQTNESMQIALTALRDRSAAVRTAAARVAGLSKDKRGVGMLCELLSDSSPQVRRQAATALGQISDPSAARALIKASENAEDRFVEHAIIFSLVQLGPSELLVEALRHGSTNVKRTALIALDQMKPSPLMKSAIIPFLESTDSLLQATGVWVLMHHPQWTDVAVSYLQRQFKNETLRSGRMKNVNDVLSVFADTPEVSAFLSKELRSTGASGDRKLLLLDAMGAATTGREGLSRALLRDLLEQDDADVQSKVVELIQTNRISGMDKELSGIVWNVGVAPEFRMKALRARLVSDARLSDAEFDLLRSLSSPSEDARTRRIAVLLLGEASLNDSQLLTLADEYVSRIDLFLLPAILDAFEGNKNERVGMALVNALDARTGWLDVVSSERLDKIFEAFPASVRAAAKPLWAKLADRHAGRLKALDSLQSRLHAGDVGEGRKVFFGKALCSTCHAVSNNGGAFGPDLTNIGEIRSEHDILEAVLYPGASVAREYETWTIKTENTTYTGIIKEQAPGMITVETGAGVIVRIPRADVELIEAQGTSMMPAGLHKQLSMQELADLMAYLATLPDGLGHLRAGK